MILAVIPARFASTRFPGKPLVEIGGKTMIQRTCEQVKKCRRVEKLVVATDDKRIFKHVQSLGYEVQMTDPQHPSGTDRCAEVVRKFPAAKFVLNVQGDEPFIQPEQIDLLAETLILGKEKIATLAKRISDAEQIFNPNVVKVAFSEKKRALFFSRHPIPFHRGLPQEEWAAAGNFFKHIGLYGFQRATLLRISKLQPSPLELAESLEQLRWLENGFSIAVGLTDLETFGIDSPADLEKIRL